jgi:hypothetical protein
MLTSQTNMFPLVLCSMLVSTVPISVVGSQFALAQKPFWQPDQYGMFTTLNRHLACISCLLAQHNAL